MLAKRIIPCLDVKGGRVVKGVNFEGLRDAGDPVEVAARYDEQGADEICFLDITASHEGRDTMLNIVEQTAKRCFCPVTVGGGIRTLDDIRRTLRAGADKVSINSSAIKNPDLIKDVAQHFGSQCIVLAIDAKHCKLPLEPHDSQFDSENGIPTLCKALGLTIPQVLNWMNELKKRLTLPGDPPSGRSKGARWNVYIHGGRVDTGLDAVAWARLGVHLGAGEILLTSMDADGTKNGYDLELTRNVAEKVGVPVIASGGAGNLEHMSEGLTKGKADAALAASIFHYGTYTLSQAREFLRSEGIQTRA